MLTLIDFKMTVKTLYAQHT